MHDDIVIIIPARYGSGRFPGKPLVKIKGEEMILHVCRNAEASGFRMMVATDDIRIADFVENKGYKAVMTSEDCNCGTERVWKAYQKTKCDARFVINLQGDEPFISPNAILTLADETVNVGDEKVGSLIQKFDKTLGFDPLFNPDVVKVTFNYKKEALYFSRSIIPYQAGVNWKKWLDHSDFYVHKGIYLYSAHMLDKICRMSVSSLQKSERLEQLTWLENGIPVYLKEIKGYFPGIDRPEDIKTFE